MLILSFLSSLMPSYSEPLKGSVTEEGEFKDTKMFTGEVDKLDKKTKLK